MPALIYPLLLLAVLEGGGAAAGWWLVVFNVVLVPLLDEGIKYLLPQWQPSPRVSRLLFARLWFWIYASLQGVTLLYALNLVSAEALTPVAYMGLVSGVGLMTGTAGLTAAHELIHRRPTSDRALGLVLLGMTSYLHFRIEHVYGHHRHVGTANDSASAEAGTTFPHFFARGLVRGAVSAWRIEAAQRSRRGLPVFAAGNRLLQYLLILLLLYWAVGLYWGWATTVFFALQSLMAVHLLEAVNYVQHYGLRRSGDARVSAADAWDSADPVSSLLVFNINRHAQHHRQPARPARALEPETASPKLPYSFFLMVFMALLPPLWRRVMDSRLSATRPSPGGSEIQHHVQTGVVHV